jgi:phage/plasmid-associated DNA primase
VRMFDGFMLDADTELSVAALDRATEKYGIRWSVKEHDTSIVESLAQVQPHHIEPDDASLARLFLHVFEENIVKDKRNKLHVYNRHEWHCQDDHLNIKHLLKGIMIKVLTPILESAIDSAAKHYFKLKLVEESAETEKAHMELMMLKDVLKKRIKMDTAINSIFRYAENLLSEMPRSNVEFDLGKEQLYHLQFKNGVLDLKTKKFRKRTHKDHITKFLQWDYTGERDADKMRHVVGFYKKLQVNPVMATFAMQWQAKMLDGDISNEKFKINIGTGGNGKSVECEIHRKCFDVYCHSIDKETFCRGYADVHKQLADLMHRPIRTVLCEEMENKKLDTSVLKTFVTGKAFPIKVMFGTTVIVDLQCTLNATSQYEPEGRVDPGILRRGQIMYYRTRFVDHGDDVDEENGVYLKDTTFADRFEDDAWKNAYLQVLLDHYVGKLNAPSELQENFKESLNANDEFADIFEINFQVVPDCFRVSKEIMMSHFPNVPFNQVKQNLKNNFNVKWERKLRADGVQGCFTGVRTTRCMLPEYNEALKE